MNRLLARNAFGLTPDGRRLALGMFFWEFGWGLYMYLLTIYMEDLGATPFQIGALLWAQGLLRIAMYCPAGIIADRYSRRSVIIVTTALTVPAIASYGFATTWWHLLPGLLLVVAGNIGTPAFGSYIADASLPDRRAETFTLIYAVGPSIAFIIAPLLGGAVADWVGARYVFFGAALAVLLATITFMALSERPQAVQTAVTVNYRSVLSSRPIRSMALLQMAVLFTMALGVTFMPNFLKEVHGYSFSWVGIFGSIGAIGSVAMALLVGQKERFRPLLLMSAAVLGIGVLCVAIVATGNAVVLVVAFLARGGFRFTWTLNSAVLSDVSPPQLLNRAFALFELLGSVGFGIAPIVAGVLYGWLPSAPLLICAMLTPAVAAAAVWVDRAIVRPLELAVPSQRPGLETLAEQGATT